MPSHTKTTERKVDRKRFLVDSLTMANDIETKFSSGIGEDKHPDESVSADRMVPYIRLLTELFGENAMQDRGIDRALWVYGHCFRQA